MSKFHCSCGYATDATESFADHFGWVFDPDDDIGNDGRTHAEVSHGNAPAHLCACGFTATDATEFNDHLLIVVITPDATGIDGEKHAPLDTAVPDHWYVKRTIDG
jgi:hypothetical protein